MTISIKRRSKNIYKDAGNLRKEYQNSNPQPIGQLPDRRILRTNPHIMWMTQFSEARHHQKMTFVQLAKSLYEQQDFCLQGHARYWAWKRDFEGHTFYLFASKRGVNLEFAGDPPPLLVVSRFFDLLLSELSRGDS